jgi:deoxyribodipyrimidine photo-lyase
MAAIWWVRQDLRLTDNPALAAAMHAGHILPVYVLDDEAAGNRALGGAQRWWLHHALAALDAALRDRGAMLLLRRGDAAEQLARLAEEVQAGLVHAASAYEPWARRQERNVARALGPGRLTLHHSRTLLDPSGPRTRTGAPYLVYTPFMRAVRAAVAPQAPLPAPRRIPVQQAARSERLEDWVLLPQHPDWARGLRATWQPGEASAQARLRDFLAHQADTYDTTRDPPAEDATSRLSPHLHWGESSPHQVWHEATRAPLRPAARNGFLNELIWREFAIHLLRHHPDLPDAPLRPDFARMPWRNDRAALRAWQRGRTGIPLVDAGMRQLWQTGWMHNRVRMIVASFLVKHLLLPWQQGERWFWDTLVDADLASNSVNWQWVSGSGADAAPYVRIFNPVLQGRKFDPDGTYIRRFVPELAALPTSAVHAPWESAVTPPDYPAPIVGLTEGRQRALAAFQQMRSAAS